MTSVIIPLSRLPTFSCCMSILTHLLSMSTFKHKGIKIFHKKCSTQCKVVWIIFRIIILLLYSPFGPGGLRAPPVVADNAKLAIVFTYFFLLFSPTFFLRLMPCLKICFPQYFGITRRNIFKKTKKTSWAEQSHTRYQLLAFPLKLYCPCKD